MPTEITKTDYYYNSNKGKTISDSSEKVTTQLDTNIDLEKMIRKICIKSDVRSPIAYLTEIMIDINLTCS